jgi:hypothetical protein
MSNQVGDMYRSSRTNAEVPQDPKPAPAWDGYAQRNEVTKTNENLTHSMDENAPACSPAVQHRRWQSGNGTQTKRHYTPDKQNSRKRITTRSAEITICQAVSTGITTANSRIGTVNADVPGSAAAAAAHHRRCEGRVEMTRHW